MPTDFFWIDQAPDLAQAAQKLTSSSPLGIDTEADSLHHYKESVSLVQITQGAENFLIDPLANLDLNPLWSALSNRTWILHGADFDLRMLRRIGAPEPRQVFDTTIAAQLLGIKAFGYAALVQEFFGHVICKKNQKADWSARPLSPDMLEYAVEDTRFLVPLAEKLTARLQELGRLGWHEESCLRIVQSSLIVKPTDPEEAWRISGSNLLSPSTLAILREVWRWRETEAERKDVPVFKVMMNEKMIALSFWTDRHRNEPASNAPNLPRPYQGPRGGSLHAALERGRSAPPVPPKPKGVRPPRDIEAEKRFDKLKEARDREADRLQLDSSFLASKATLLEIARDPSEAPSRLIGEARWCRWQLELLQPTIQTL